MISPIVETDVVAPTEVHSSFIQNEAHVPIPQPCSISARAMHQGISPYGQVRAVQRWQRNSLVSRELKRVGNVLLLKPDLRIHAPRGILGLHTP